jgi:hypothetical protein
MVKRSVTKEVNTQEELDRLIVSGIRRVRATGNKLGSQKLRAGPYGKQRLLQEIYTVYCGWRDSRRTQAISERLAKAMRVESLDRAPHLLTLLIRVALPNVEPNVVANWVDAIRYGEAHYVRPFKLRSFLFLKGGLISCARTYRAEEKSRREAEEVARLDAECRAQARRKRRPRRGHCRAELASKEAFPICLLSADAGQSPRDA